MTANRTTLLSPFGSIVLIWSSVLREPKVTRIIIPRPDCSTALIAAKMFSSLNESSCMEIDALKLDIEAFLSGEEISFGLETVQLEKCPPFQQSVLEMDYAIPRGSINTYGGIAQRLGKPGSSRAVGNALAGNPFPFIIPCHRVIRSDGTLGGYQGGTQMKKKLLEYEGIIFNK